MNDSDRLARNNQKLAECYPTFANLVRDALQRVEQAGFRPRIQDGWRSPADQLKAYESGHSKLRFGLHNVTGSGGTKESLAVDVLDDDQPLAPTNVYLLTLAIAARSDGLETGILWGLPQNLAKGVEDAVAANNTANSVKVGWDPTHVQVVGITASAAKKGERPA